MLQRIQTLWLLLAAASSFLTFKFSFFSGNRIGENQVKTFEYLTASTNLIILVLTVMIVMASLVTIFLFKNRKLQLRLIFAATFISIINLVLYYLQTKKFAEGNYDLTALLSIIVPVLLILAARGIYKDEKLVKSLDRLR